MEKSSTSENSGGKAQTEPRGPRTCQGKARACQNSTTHGVSVTRIFPAEKETAALLSEGFRKELRPRGALEFEIVTDLVLNRLQKQRLDRYVVHEYQKALVCASRSRLENHEQRQTKAWLRIANAEAGTQGTDCDRFPPERCIEFLVALKDKIGKRGVKADEDLVLLDLIYGKQMTAPAAMLACHLKRIKLAERQRAEGGEKGGPEQREDEELVLRTIEAEIETQKTRIEVERALDDMEYGSDAPVLPPDLVLERIERYRTAKEREFSRCLRNLETVRRLRGDTYNSRRLGEDYGPLLRIRHRFGRQDATVGRAEGDRRWPRVAVLHRVPQSIRHWLPSAPDAL